MKLTLLGFATWMALSVSGPAFGADADMRAQIKALCPAYTSTTKEASLNSLNPPAKVESGVTLPGSGQTLFRGIYDSNPQFSYQTVISGLFGQDNWVMGSPMHWGITLVLTGSRTTYDLFGLRGIPHNMWEYYKARGIHTDIQTLLGCVKPKFYNSDQSNYLAKELMNKYFSSLSVSDISERYLNIVNPLYYDATQTNLGFANNAIDLVISSYNDQIASLYGLKILVLKDKRNRAVDLGYWNAIKNGKYWADWVDNGEVNTPGYITASELVGYQQRAKDRPMSPTWADSEPNNPILYAFYKINYKGTDVVAVVDGGGELCMVQDDKTQKLSYCVDTWSGRIMTQIIPAPTSRGAGYKNRAGIMGVILNCDGKCSVPDGFFEWYEKTSNTDLPAAVQTAITGMSVNGKKLSYVKAPNLPPPASALPGVLKVVSATYALPADMTTAKGNVTAQAAAFADGKGQVTYKVSTRFLGLKDPSQAREFILEYTCSNKPKNVRTEKINAPAEGKIFSLDCDEGS